MRVGVIGCGLIGHRRADVVRGSVGDELVIIADIERSRAEAVAGLTGCSVTTNWQEVVVRDDVDVIIVSTTNNWLAPVTIAALRHGKHVLCEKPLGRNPEESRQMLEAASMSGRKLKTGFNHRYHGAIWKAHELSTQGAIGDILFIRCRYGHGGRPGYDKEWRANPEISGGGELLDQGIHVVDLFRWFLGDFVEGCGFIATYFWGSVDGQRYAVGDRAEDNGFGLFRTAAGQVASLHTSWTQWKNTFSFEIFGRDGYLIVDGLGGSYGPERLTWGRRRPESGPPHEQSFDFSGPDISWGAEWQEFVAAICEDREPLGNGHDGWQAMKMVYAVYESCRTGSVVRMVDDKELVIRG